MRWWPAFSCVLVASCTFELDPLVTDSDLDSGGAAGASGGEDAGCVTLGCASGGSSSGGTGAASGGGTAGAGAGSGAGGGGGTSGGTGGFGAGGSGAGGTGGAGGAGGTGAAGGGGSTFACINLDQAGCSLANAAACLCEGCDPVFCFDPINGYPVSDCVCPVCWPFDECSNPSYCVNDGLCDPYGEGCNCPDCYDHALCF